MFFSPISVSIELAVLLAGAKYNTMSQIKSTLNLNNFATDDEINQAFQSVLNSTCSICSNHLIAASKIVVQNNFTILQSYLDILTKYFKTKVEKVDFISNASSVADQINSWVKQQTNKTKENLFPPKSLSPSTVFLLVSAMYFKGYWETAFNAKHTTQDHFTLSNGKTVLTSTMNAYNTFFYGENSQLNCKILKLDYLGQRLTMYVILPNQADGLASLINQLTTENFNILVNSVRPSQVIVKLPTFKLRFGYNLKEYLKKQGITDLFNHLTADLTGIFNKTNASLFVSNMEQRAFVDIYENGTTAIDQDEETLLVSDKFTYYRYHYGLQIIVFEFYATHPFVFVIYDTSTNLILFMGNVNNPQN
ncbi:Serpin peptidase inhibitor, clade B (Ovalbumin), member [Chamberlinius hualienensis]